MRNVNASISVGAAFILGAGAGWIAKGEFVDYLFSHYVPAIITLLAAYYGAKFAFEFQSRKENKEQKNRKIISGNLAVFKLSTMISSLMSYQIQVIDPVRGKYTAFLEMLPTLSQEIENISIDIDSLAFLLGTDDQNLLGELSIEKSRYDAAIAAINDRSVVHRNEAQPTLDAAGMKNGGSCTREEMQSVLGERLFHTLHQSTDQVIYHVDSTILSLKEMSDNLAKALKKLFPDERIISIEMPEERENPAEGEA
ncbi:MAG: hypothetical protein PF692_14015 [Kiritimatiellae bacterium]|nr:hypothetical protein [Kiritimatiellia bacterium]